MHNLERILHDLLHRITEPLASKRALLSMAIGFVLVITVTVMTIEIGDIRNNPVLQMMAAVFTDILAFVVFLGVIFVLIVLFAILVTSLLRTVATNRERIAETDANRAAQDARKEAEKTARAMQLQQQRAIKAPGYRGARALPSGGYSSGYSSYAGGYPNVVDSIPPKRHPFSRALAISLLFVLLSGLGAASVTGPLSPKLHTPCYIICHTAPAAGSH